MTITLPEAIRRGSALQPQAFYRYVSSPPDDGGTGDCCTCALGAAVAGIVGLPVDPDHFPFDALAFIEEGTNCDLSQQVLPEDLPYPYWRSVKLEEAITVLNDCYLWSREQIADWVEQYLQGAERSAEA